VCVRGNHSVHSVRVMCCVACESEGVLSCPHVITANTHTVNRMVSPHTHIHPVSLSLLPSLSERKRDRVYVCVWGNHSVHSVRVS